VKEIDDIEIDCKIYVDSASRSNYYNSPVMVTTTTAVVAKPFPWVPRLPDNGSPFANGFIPPYEDHKSNKDDCRTLLLKDIPLPDNGGPFANDSNAPGKPGEPPQDEDKIVAINEKGYYKFDNSSIDEDFHQD